MKTQAQTVQEMFYTYLTQAVKLAKEGRTTLSYEFYGKAKGCITTAMQLGIISVRAWQELEDRADSKFYGVLSIRK